jgi:hypothetical protein
MFRRRIRWLGVIILIALLLLTAGLWWRLPASPRAAWNLPDSCEEVIVSSDGSTILTSHPGEIILWDASGPPARHRLTCSHPQRFSLPQVLILSPDGKQVAFTRLPFVGQWLWNPDLHADPLPLADAAQLLGFTPDGSRLITRADKFADLMYWEPATGKVAERLSLPGRLHTTPWVGGNKRLAIVEIDQDGATALEVWDLYPGKRVVRLPAFGADGVAEFPLGEAIVSPDLRRLANRKIDGVPVWDLGTGKKLGVIPPEADGEKLTPYQFNADGSRLIVLSGQTPVVWDVEQFPARRLGALAALPQTDPYFLAFSRDGQWLVYLTVYLRPGGNPGWPLYNAATLERVNFPCNNFGGFSPDGRWIVATPPSTGTGPPTPPKWWQSWFDMIGLKIPGGHSTRGAHVCALPEGRPVLQLGGKQWVWFADSRSLVAFKDDTIENLRPPPAPAVVD